MAGVGDKDAEGIAFFEKSIRPLLVEHCYKCHASTAKRVKGGLLLDTQEGLLSGGDSGPAIVPGKPDESLLIEAVHYENEDLEMPPKGKLSDEQIRLLVEWVKMGAPDPRSGGDAEPLTREIDIEGGKKFWSFQPPKETTPPQVKDGSWPRDDIDRFILAGVEEKGLSVAADADRPTLLRRVTFDLTGLPPTPEEVEAFGSDKSPNAFEKVVDRLLGSDRFGERWGRHWLDIARYGESTGKTRNYPYSHAWRYRDWVIKAFNDDKPYDRFLREQIAGDLLPARGNQEIDDLRTATAFLAMGPKDLNERNKLQYEMDNLDEQLDTMSRAVLGLTIGCARCHDHKFDPIPTADYYAMAGIFKSSETLVGYGSKQGGGNRYNASALYPLAGSKQATEVEQSAKQKKGKETVDTVAAELQEKIRDKRQELRKLQQAGKRKGKRAQDRKARDKKSDKNDISSLSPDDKKRARKLQQELKQLAQQLKKGQKKNNKRKGSPAPKVSMIMGVRDRDNPQDCRIFVRGEVSSPASSVERGFLQVIGNLENADMPSDASGRLELARWISTPRNPLTARVMVNRIWHHLFGRGLVRTVDNFGSTGSSPTHPELLDHLALRFVADGWSVKKLIRAVVLTRSYGMSSAHDEENYAKDPDNNALWRMRQRRLDAEAFRDAMLAISGRLQLTPPKGSVVSTLAVGEIGRNVSFAELQRGGAPVRSVYLPIVRGFVPEMLKAFDFAEPSMVKGRRDVTTVSTQALFLLNSPFVGEQSGRFAERLLEDEKLSDSDRIDLAYRLALGRTPIAEEELQALNYVNQSLEVTGGKESGRPVEAWAGLCQALLASAEFRYLN